MFFITSSVTSFITSLLQDLTSVATFALRLIHIITALPVGNLARVMTSVSRLNLHVKSVLLSQNS